MPWGPPGSYPPPPPPPRRRSRLGRVVLLLLLLLLVGSLGINAMLLLDFGGSATRSVQTTTLVTGSSDEIAVLPLDGEIDAAASDRIDRFFDKVDESPNVKAVVVEVNSPGGTVTAADEIYKRIRRYKDDRRAKKRNDTVVVSMKSMATSGGYYAACAADYIVAEPTTLTANIGVLMPQLNFSELFDKYGVKETTIVSTGAVYKNAGSPYAAPNPEDQKYLQGLADRAFERFKQVVNEGRGGKLVKEKLPTVFTGRVFAASEALEAGLIDEIGYPRDAWYVAARSANLVGPTIIRYEEPKLSLSSLLPFVSSNARPATAYNGLTINGINVNAGPEALDRLATPRLLYRWRGN